MPAETPSKPTALNTQQPAESASSPASGSPRMSRRDLIGTSAKLAGVAGAAGAVGGAHDPSESKEHVAPDEFGHVISCDHIGRRQAAVRRTRICT